MDKKKILYFGDFGIDDAIALIYAYLSGQFEIVGLVADYGNAPREVTYRNINYLLNIYGKDNIAVIAGAEKPMTGEAPQFFPEVHGIQGLGPIIPQEKAVRPQENFCKAVEIIRKYKDELIVVCTGRLTSLATLFLLYGDLMNTVKAFYVMGGAFLVPGNVTAVAEANFYGDPVAANIVMKYAKNSTIFPLNATMKAVVTPKMADYIDIKGKTKLVKPLLDFYYKFYKAHYPNIKGSPMHDVITMMGITNKSIFRYVYSQVNIEIDKGIAQGESIADFRYIKDIAKDRAAQKIAMDFDYRDFYTEFMKVMAG